MRAPSRTFLVTLAALGALLVLAGPWLIPQYRVDRLTLGLVYGISTIGLVILTGRAGQLSIGHSAFFGLGAYVVAILLSREWAPLAPALAAAGLAAAASGWLFGKPALRLSGFNLAIVTAALAIVFPLLLQRFTGLTGGHAGLAVPPQYAPWGLPLSPVSWIYMVAVIVMILAMLVGWLLTRGRMGRALDAIRLNEATAEANGINVAGYKQAAFAVSAGYAGVGGGVYAAAVGYIAPEAFGLLLNLTFLAALLAGGSRYLGGAVLGGMIVQTVPELAGGVSQALTQAIFGLVLIAVITLAPQGLMGAAPVDRLRKWIMGNRPSRMAPKPEGS